ncbi:hypothetical protein SAY87_002020 [Trapa incisa]|uniref:phospholipase D n=1 Tax=Trapa incisa TaxID=236973 RepID=A0AAN7PU37_9MYRT|nr:hypothetical protein SAY87_002020 [Trapa incisa]
MRSEKSLDLGLGRGIFKLYAEVHIGNARVCRTRLLETASHQPIRWNESFQVYCAHQASCITFSIKENNPLWSAALGTASIPIDQSLLSGQAIDQWLDISGDQGKLHVKIKFDSAIRDPNWSKGLGRLDFRGVPSSFFPQTDGCRVSLYQDAHIPDDFTKSLNLPEGRDYRPRQCWKDVFDAISEAKHFIYITGWSVYSQITLVRDLGNRSEGGGENQETPLTLGDLLRRKADQGVRVLMLVWDDPTSFQVLNKDGVMTTHDEDTKKYFQESGVHCVLCRRESKKGQSLIRSLMFTHHQKTIVVDSGDVSQKRRIVSFIGGLDLCDGRYDTPEHSLFRSLNSAHAEDFRQPNFKGASLHRGGPRQPWHDIHCRIEGPAAWDVLMNFEQRWEKQGGDNHLLLKLDDLKNVFISRSEGGFDRDWESWKVQIFRSIDGDAASGLLKTADEASERGLIIDRGKVIDRSIQHAYINAIRRAKDFIYIENQYFIGSSFCWKDADGKIVEDVKAMNLIPKELSLKIASKIAAGERFAVYVVIPMWPEGFPESDSVQTMLHWQRRTMEMMYGDILKAIKDKGIEADPLDYLSFFCLGNRETEKDEDYVPLERPEVELGMHPQDERHRRQELGALRKPNNRRRPSGPPA